MPLKTSKTGIRWDSPSAGSRLVAAANSSAAAPRKRNHSKKHWSKLFWRSLISRLRERISTTHTSLWATESMLTSRSWPVWRGCSSGYSCFQCLSYTFMVLVDSMKVRNHSQSVAFSLVTSEAPSRYASNSVWLLETWTLSVLKVPFLLIRAKFKLAPCLINSPRSPGAIRMPLIFSWRRIIFPIARVQLTAISCR